MPIYEYSCADCEHAFELVQKMTDPAPENCPGCGGSNVGKMMSSGAFHLKGGGWYSDGYSKEKKSTSADLSKTAPKTPPCGNCPAS